MMFKTIKDAIELDPRLIGDPKIISEEFSKSISKTEHELKEHSDFAMAYGELLDTSKLIVQALDKFVARYSEADKNAVFELESPELTVTVGMVYIDSRGLRIDPPYMGVKMDDSDWYPVKRVNEMALEFAERKLSEEAE